MLLYATISDREGEGTENLSVQPPNEEPKTVMVQLEPCP